VDTASFIFISEAARIIGVSQQTLRAWEITGRLVPQRIALVRVYERAVVEKIARTRHDERSQITTAGEGHAR